MSHFFFDLRVDLVKGTFIQQSWVLQDLLARRRRTLQLLQRKKESSRARGRRKRASVKASASSMIRKLTGKRSAQFS